MESTTAPAKIDPLAIETISHRAKLVLHQQRASTGESFDCKPADAKACMPSPESARRSRSLLRPQRDIADAHLYDIEKRMRPNIPPDLLGIVDAVRLDQQTHRRPPSNY
jgi:hypothetical protein